MHTPLSSLLLLAALNLALNLTLLASPAGTPHDPNALAPLQRDYLDPGDRYEYLYTDQIEKCASRSPLPRVHSALTPHWLSRYSIDMTEYTPSDYNQCAPLPVGSSGWPGPDPRAVRCLRYTSINDWFIRKLAPGARQFCHTRYPLAFPTTLVAPADARVMAWQTSMPSTRSQPARPH